MISFIKGEVYAVLDESIVVENNNIGYEILMGRPDLLSIGDEVFVHTYQHVREDEISLFGFLDVFERKVFLLLITVKGIGPKTANNILSKANANDIASAISNQDINYLKTLPGIGPKSAQQIVLDLQKKLVFEETVTVNSALSDALSGLKSLGMTSQDIKYVEKRLSSKVMTTDEYLKAGLQLINKRKVG